MIDILVTGDTIFTGKEVIRDGYVYIKNGVIEAIGSGLPPEDQTYASLIIGGSKRTVAPAIVWPIDPLGYLMKTPKCKPETPPCNTRKRFTPDLESKILLPAVMEAHLHGIGIPLLVASSLQPVITIAKNLGGKYGALIPEKCGPITQHEGLAVVARPAVEPSICITKDLCRKGNPYEFSVEVSRILGLDPPLLKEGSHAVLTVFDNTRTPLLGTTIRDPEDAGYIYSMGAKVESLIVGPDILVEIGEHLLIAEKHVKDALKILDKVMGQ